MAEIKEVSLLDIANGAIQERLAVELKKTVDNILDPNTPPKEARTITLKATFNPNEERDNVALSIKCDSKPAASKPIETTIYVDERADGPIAVEISRQIHGQLSTDGSEEGENRMIRLA